MKKTLLAFVTVCALISSVHAQQTVVIERPGLFTDLATALIGVPAAAVTGIVEGTAYDPGPGNRSPETGRSDFADRHGSSVDYGYDYREFADPCPRSNDHSDSHDPDHDRLRQRHDRDRDASRIRVRTRLRRGLSRRPRTPRRVKSVRQSVCLPVQMNMSEHDKRRQS